MKEKDYCVSKALLDIGKTSIYNILKAAGMYRYGNRRLIIRNKVESKPCDCSYCRGQRQIINLQLRNSLDNIESHLKLSRKKNEEYDKTVRLLGLMNNNNTAARKEKEVR